MTTTSGPKVTKIFGPPGTGKTTELIRIVEEAMKGGVRPERIAYVAFTRKAAQEAVARAKEHFGMTADRFPNFRTLHSLAFRKLGINRAEVMHEEHYRELGARLGFRFSGMGGESDALVPAGTLLGDKVARIESLARLRGATLREQWEASAEKDCPYLAAEQWVEGVRRFKEERGFFDFTDLLERYDGAMDVDVFIVDEAQDLSPLQWKVAETAWANAARVYVAGDDDQAIYGWAGADVSRFLDLPGESRTLPRSYRLPSRVQALALGVARGIRVRREKEWAPRDEPGSVEYVRYESAIDPSAPGSWLMLARNHSQLRRFEALLLAAGYPYRVDGRHSTDVPATRAVLAWERGRKGATLSAEELKNLWSFLDVGDPRIHRWTREDRKLTEMVTPEALRRPWMDALARVPADQREYLRACLRNGAAAGVAPTETLLGEPRFVISTIHRAKGGEADNVALVTDISMKPWNALTTDEEKRVLYVALTRARRRLVVVQPQTLRHYSV